MVFSRGFKVRVCALAVIATLAASVESGFAQTSGNQPLPLQKRLANIETSCLKRDWSKANCDISRKFGADYQRSGAENILEKLDEFGMRATTAFRSKEDRTQVQSIYESLIDQLKAAKEKQQLSGCQSACLVACVTSNLAVYDDQSLANGFETEDPAVNILIRGAGVCRHYAIVATDLASGIGLRAKTATSESGNHAFLGVEVDGRWAYIEPQIDSCRFYEFDGHDSGATVGNDKRMWFEDSDQTPPKALAYIPKAGDSSGAPSQAKPRNTSRSAGVWMSDQARAASTDGPISIFGPYAMDRYGISVGSITTGAMHSFNESSMGLRVDARIVDTDAGRSVAALSASVSPQASTLLARLNPLEFQVWSSANDRGADYSALVRPANSAFQLSTDEAQSIVVAPEAALAYKIRGDFITSEVEVQMSPLVWGYVPALGENDPTSKLGQHSMFATRLGVSGMTQFAVSDVEHLELQMGVEKLIDLNSAFRLPDLFALSAKAIYSRNTQKGGSWYLGFVAEERPLMNSAFTGFTFGIRPPH